jgi:hypothetical protein
LGAVADLNPATAFHRQGSQARVVGSTVFRSDQSAAQEAAGHAPRRRAILKLPKAQRELPHWQTAVACLMQIGDRGGDPMFPHIATMQALHRHEQQAPAAPRRKRAKAYKIVR